MKNKIALLFLLASSIASSAQEETNEQFIHRGLFRAMGSIAEGAMFEQGVTNLYLTGNIEYYISDNISLRGDGNYFVSTMGDLQPFDHNHSILSGASFHFKTKSHFDPYLGFAPGISITKMSYANGFICDPGPCTGDGYETKSAINPLVSSLAGFNFYFQKAFHLFLETRYIYGRHLSDAAPQSLSELRFTFGLGFNLNFIKKKQ